jgi:hypothetical protein
MLRRVVLVRTDVSEERSASIRVTRIGELGKMLALTRNRRRLRRNKRRENLKSYMLLFHKSEYYIHIYIHKF